MRLPLYVSYAQLAVFLPLLDEPFNDWQQAHVDQGFAWRPNSVSFTTLVEEGTHNVELSVVADNVGLAEEAIRVIEVPFEIPLDGAVNIATITEEHSVSLEPGLYMLRAEFLPRQADSTYTVRLHFMPGPLRDAKVIKADSALRVPSTLIMTAAPAS